MTSFHFHDGMGKKSNFITNKWGFFSSKIFKHVSLKSVLTFPLRKILPPALQLSAKIKVSSVKIHIGSNNVHLCVVLGLL